MSALRIGMVTREWPPKVYGGAGVHVNNLVAALRSLSEKGSLTIDVHCFDGPRDDAHGYSLDPSLDEGSRKVNPALATMLIDHDIAMAIGRGASIDLVHSHTWYANFAGELVRRAIGIPHVITAHSLEPLRPWKAEQLGSGYAISSWIEESTYRNADAIIAVSDGMREDVLKSYPFLDPSKVKTIYNGIDSNRFAPNPSMEFLTRAEIKGPFALFVGRITRQKGLAHLLRAWRRVTPDLGLVVAAGNPDEPAIGGEIETLIHELKEERGNIWHFPSMLTHDELTELLTHAEAFLCPSIYEPLGIVNLEAMACECPVIATSVGGIPEVVMHGVTGDLVPLSLKPEDFEFDFAETINLLYADDQRRARYGKAGRERVQREFGWDRIAEQTRDLYRALVE
ncbi:MAG: glycogen synthase [Candidatus Nanopelagicaceae bacterium]